MTAYLLSLVTVLEQLLGIVTVHTQVYRMFRALLHFTVLVALQQGRYWLDRQVVFGEKLRGIYSVGI